MNSTVDNASVNVHECEKCLKLKTELLNKKDFIEKEAYDKLFRRFTTLEKHCISLEVDTQLNQEIFQRDNSVSNQSAPNFDQYFELNKLKAQSQEKDTVIKKLKETIKSLSGNMNEDKEQAAILKEIVEQGKSQNPLNNSLDSALADIGIFIDFDELTAMVSEHDSLGPALHEMTPATISSGLMPNPPPSTPVDRPAPEFITLIVKVVAPEPAASTGSPSSTIVDQDAPSPSNSQTSPETQSLVIPNDVKEDDHDLDFAHMNHNSFFGILIPENDSKASSSLVVIPTIVHTAAPNSEHVTKWTKDHPLGKNS
ncbi:hypothetical protein Tco_1215623 [Tanacetum coccineum]